MASPLKGLISDGSRYVKSFKLFLERSYDHQRMLDFIASLLPDILASTVNEKSHLNVIGVGSGSGELDLKMFSALHLKYPQVTMDNEVVEPSAQHLHDYTDLVSQTPGLDYIHFNWNNMTAEEFQEQWKEKKMTKKADIIHMIQMLYYVKDLGDTISFYQGLLNKNGKLLISLVSGRSAWEKLWQIDIYTYVSTDDIKRLLDSKGLSYQSYELPSQMEITECFTEGDENGELLLDFLTHVLHFSKSASPEQKAEVLEILRHPDCSVESSGKVMFKYNNEVIVVDQLT